MNICYGYSKECINFNQNIYNLVAQKDWGKMIKKYVCNTYIV